MYKYLFPFAISATFVAVLRVSLDTVLAVAPVRVVRLRMTSPVKSSFPEAADRTRNPGGGEARAGDRPVRDSLLGFLAVTAAVSLLYRLRGVAFIERNLAVIAAVLFLYLPALLLWRGGRDLEQYGLRAAPLRRGLLAFGFAGLLVFDLARRGAGNRGVPIRPGPPL